MRFVAATSASRSNSIAGLHWRYCILLLYHCLIKPQHDAHMRYPHVSVLFCYKLCVDLITGVSLSWSYTAFWLLCFCARVFNWCCFNFELLLHILQLRFKFVVVPLLQMLKCEVWSKCEAVKCEAVKFYLVKSSILLAYMCCKDCNRFI